MKTLTVELEKLSKSLSKDVDGLLKTWKKSFNLLEPSISPAMESMARDLTGQIQSLVQTMPAHLTQGLQPLLGGITADNLPQALEQLQNVASSPSIAAGLAGILGVSAPTKPSDLSPLSDIVIMEGCFGRGINAGCIASGATGAFGSLRNLEGMLSGSVGDVNKVIGNIFGNINNPEALIGSLPSQLLGPAMEVANSVVGTFGSGIANALGSLANPQMLGSVFGGLSSVIGSVTSSMQGLMSGLAGSLSSAVGSIAGSVQGLVGGLTSSLSGVMGSLQDVVGNVFGGLSSITGALDNIGGMFGNLDGLLGGFSIDSVLSPNIDFVGNICTFGGCF